MDETGGPLTDLLQSNGDVIDGAIHQYGAANVAAFFINFGFGMATAYDLPNFDWQNTKEEGEPTP